MKKTRFLSLITMLIAIVLIVTGYSMMFINEFMVDAEEKSTYASLIKNSFRSYSTDLEDISYDIKSTNIFNIKYYAELRTNYSSNIIELSKIEQKIKAMETSSNALLYECKIRDYNDYDIEYKCDTISYNYESIINAYVSIVYKYNEKIENYNNWLQKQNNQNLSLLNSYKSNYYTEYVDINEDGEYSGIIK